jgi:hypothetical protein
MHDTLRMQLVGFDDPSWSHNKDDDDDAADLI